MKEKEFLLHHILDQFEASAKWNQDFTGNKSFRIEEKHYKAITRAALIHEARTLEQENLIQIKWVTPHHDIELVRYSNEQIPIFYERVHRTPKYRIVQEQKLQVREAIQAIPTCSWSTRYLETLLNQLEKGKYKVTSEEQAIQSLLLTCLIGLEQLQEPTYKRAFSKRYLGNSKTFEKELQKTILTIARKYHDEVEDSMEDHEVLSCLYLEEYAVELHIKGTLTIELNSHVLDMNMYPYGTILNSETLKRATIPDGQQIKKIITVENKANFMAIPFEEHTLILFTHGYFSPLEKRFLRTLNSKLMDSEACTYYHTGDLDYGGISIYHNIKKTLYPKLQPLNMAAGLLLQYNNITEPIKKETKDKLFQFYNQKKEQVPELMELMEAILETNQVLEQEAFL